MSSLKYIKKIIELLGNTPTYTSEKNAKNFFHECIQHYKLSSPYVFNYTDEYRASGNAITLHPSSVGNHTIDNYSFKVHARVHEDWYEWVNFFIVWSECKRYYIIGDYESLVYYNNEDFFKMFYNKFKPQVWDYGDI